MAFELVRLGVQDFLPTEILNKDILKRVLLYAIERKKYEEKIHKSEATMLSLLESINEGIYGVDTEGTCIFVNPACVQMLGFQHSNEILGRNMNQLIHHSANDNDANNSLVHESLRTGREITSINTALWRKDGTTFQAECNIIPIKYRDKITGAVVNIIDTQEKILLGQKLHQPTRYLENLLVDRIEYLRKMNQEYLDESRFNYALLNILGALVIVLDSNGRFIRFNQKCERVTGYTFDEVIGKPVWEIFITPNELSSVKNVFNNLMAGNFPSTFENYWLTKSGDKRFISWSNTALLNDCGKVEYVIASGIDITERINAEKALNQSENLYQILASNLPGIVYQASLSEKHHTNYLNGMVYEMTGYQAEDVATGTIFGFDSIIHEDDLPQVAETLTMAILENMPYELEYRIRHKNGGIRYFSDRGRPILSDDEPGYLEGVIFDVTSKKESIIREQQRMLELAHANRLGAIGEMATEIAHELNQPLGAIVAYCDASIKFLNAKPIAISEINNALNSISTQALRASEIIRGLRNFVVKKETSPSTTNISDLIQSVIRLCEIEARANNVKIRLLIEKKLPFVLVEKILIEQVILNLLRNSIEVLSGIDDRDRNITIKASNKAREIAVTIQDTGTGLPFENPMEAFDAFITTKRDGMGMGLPISKRIIEAHGGKFIILSNTREGVALQFTLPT